MAIKKVARSTRRNMGYGCLGLLFCIVFWIVMPGDIHTNELSAVSILLPCLTSGVIAFITGEVINDVKKRKHNGSDQKTTEKDTD